MKNPKFMKLLISIVAGVFVAFVGWLGLSIDRGIVEDAIEEGVARYQVEDEALSLEFEGEVMTVIDGDTVKVVTAEDTLTVRIIGIDTPEIAGSPEGEQCYGREASKRAKELLTGKKVTITTDSTQDTYDKYDRILGYITVDGSDFGEAMVREGYAYEFTYRNQYQNQSLYRAAETEALENKRGLWSMCSS